MGKRHAAFSSRYQVVIMIGLLVELIVLVYVYQWWMQKPWAELPPLNLNVDDATETLTGK